AAAPGSRGHRIRGLLVAFATVVIASGWWVVVMELIPASARPFVGGSTNGTALDLILGYDGLGRIFGGSGPGGGGTGGGPGGGGFSGNPGILRLFNDQLGGQVAWFLPLAVVGLGVGILARRRAPRTDLRRAAYLMWGLWLAVHVIVFSFMSGIIHSYYDVVMAPAIGGSRSPPSRSRSRRYWRDRSRMPSTPCRPPMAAATRRPGRGSQTQPASAARTVVPAPSRGAARAASRQALPGSAARSADPT